MKVYLKELQEIKQRIQEINNIDLYDVHLYDLKGNHIDIPLVNIEEWKFTGLTNFEFLLAEGKFITKEEI